MATTAVPVSDRETPYEGGTLRDRARRLRPPALRGYGFSRANLLSVDGPVSVVVFPQDHTWNNAIPQGSGRTTRILNVAVAALGLVIAAPILLLIALAIKLTSRGPVFYKQTRIGLDRRWNKVPSHEDERVRDLGGRPFTMYKFRTMVAEAESDSKEVWAKPGDQRVTKLGRYLRITRLDELAQLLNVVKGEMNIVGPRPERPTIFAELREAIPNYHLRQRVMPGITGWAQVNQAYDTCVDDVRRKVQYDLDYLRTRSVVQDLVIMARTIPIMLLCRLGW